MELQQHWDQIYEKVHPEKLSWYESSPEPSLQLIEKCKLSKNARVLHAGSGSSKLVDILIERGFKNQIVSDISASALLKLRERLGFETSGKIEWVLDDLTRPTRLLEIEPVDLWHDRAVMHFFTEEKEQKRYFELVRRQLKPGGYAIIAAYNLKGAKKCSGLPVKNYDAEMLSRAIGRDFSLVEAFDYGYEMHSGEIRPFVYTLFQRKETSF